MCAKCTRPVSACYCHLIERLDNQHVEVSILRHSDEVRNPLGTAKILQQSLARCQLYDGVTFPSDAIIDPSKNYYLLYPGVGSRESLLEGDCVAGEEKASICLVVLDGTWRNTREILLKNPYLGALPRLSMEFPPSRYIVRKAPDVSMVSTVESVVYMLDALYQALGVGKENESFQPILKAFDYMVAYQIEKMGPEVFKKNYGGS